MDVAFVENAPCRRLHQCNTQSILTNMGPETWLCIVENKTGKLLFEKILAKCWPLTLSLILYNLINEMQPKIYLMRQKWGNIQFSCFTTLKHELSFNWQIGRKLTLMCMYIFIEEFVVHFTLFFNFLKIKIKFYK